MPIQLVLPSPSGGNAERAVKEIIPLIGGSAAFAELASGAATMARAGVAAAAWQAFTKAGEFVQE